MSSKLVSPAVRGSYPHLDIARAMPGEKEEKAKFSIVLMLDKKNKEHMAFFKKLKAGAKACAVERFGKDLPRGIKWPWKDGDDKEDEAMHGHVLLNCTASKKYRPKVVDRQLQEIDPLNIGEECYPGAWYRVSTNPYSWDHPTGGKGVSFGLNNVQKVKDDEQLGGGGGSSPEDDFEPFVDDEIDDDFAPAIDDLEDDEEGAAVERTEKAARKSNSTKGTKVSAEPDDDGLGDDNDLDDDDLAF